MSDQNTFVVAIGEVVILAQSSSQVREVPGMLTTDQLVLRERIQQEVEYPCRTFRLFLRPCATFGDDVQNTLNAVLANGGEATYDEIARLPRCKYTIEGVIRAVMLGENWRS